jgi:uncharacterized protein (DUF488 family)
MSRPTLRLATIGYEDATLEAFLETLKRARIELLLDVRELPSSRRKGFSRTPLSKALAAEGIDYRHERALGTPREMRHRFREHGDLDRYFGQFRQYLAKHEDVLDSVAGELKGSVALMCFERNPAECHRSIVAEALARRRRVTVKHLMAPSPMRASRPRRRAASS